MDSGTPFMSVPASLFSKDPFEPASVVTLSHDEWYVFGCSIENHDETDGNSIPQKNKGAKSMMIQ
jgi:hypothetical protein